MSTTQGNDGDATSCNRARAMAKLREAVLFLADDDCPASHQLADQVIDKVDAFRGRMQWHRAHQKRMSENTARLESEAMAMAMAKCKHKPVESKSVRGPYVGPLPGRYTNPNARGDTTRTDFCRCGARRLTNVSGAQQEIGRWEEQLNLNLNLESEKKKPQPTDGRYLSKCSTATSPEGRGLMSVGPTESYAESPEARRGRFRVV